MFKRKSRNENRPPSTVSFVAWWAVSYAAFCITLWGLLEASPSTALNWPMCTVGTVGILVLISTFQAQLGQWFFRHPMQRWIDSGSVGSLLSIVLLAAASHITPVWAVAILTLPVMFVQTAWLGRYSRWAWLWPLANLLILLPAAQYPQLHDKGTFALMILAAGLTQGVLKGLLISKLWAALPKPEKRKRFLVSESDQFEEDAAIQRLSLHETADAFIDEESLPLRKQQADLF